MVFYISAACVQRPPYSIRQPLHSRPYCSGALGFLPPRRHAGSGKASLAPCALAGDPLAQTVCGRRLRWVGTTVTHTGVCINSPSASNSSQSSYPSYWRSILLSAARIRDSAISSFIFHHSSFPKYTTSGGLSQPRAVLKNTSICDIIYDDYAFRQPKHTGEP